MALKILVVEDQRALVANVFEYFEARGHVLDAAPDGLTGLALARDNDYDVIILDWMLPRLDGLAMLQRLRGEHGRHTPTVLLSARGELEQKLEGFRQGVDDYITKPFAMVELEARLLAVVARSQGAASRDARVLEVADLTFNLATAQVKRAGVSLQLYPACRTLLEALMRNSPAVVSRQRLERALWGDDPPDADRLRSHMHVLRRAVDGPFPRKLIQTVHREGYRLAEP